MHHRRINHLKLKIETHWEGLNPALINQQEIFIELEIFPQIRDLSLLMCLANLGITPRFTVQFSKLSKGVKTDIAYEWDLNPSTCFAPLQKFNLQLHFGAKRIILFLKKFSG